MADGRHLRRRKLFEAAVELPADQQPRFLADQCGADDTLRADVEALIRHDRDADASFLDHPIDPMPTAPDARTLALTSDVDRDPRQYGRLPSTIGPYEIVRLIGMGGMGAVYEARQRSPSRIVALKVVRSELVTRKTVSRFLREGHILGQLQHPGIAQIYEAGMAAIESETEVPDRPYFAMELVQGKALHVYAKEAQLGVRARAELVAKICDALHHAHEHGVVHRDLKPDNILVDRSGQPKVLDFGVARLMDADVRMTTLRTDAGQLIGTIAYMSPEQVAGESQLVDARSDVYTLGVILYELLAGRLPHEVPRCSIPEAIRLIREEDASRLSSFDAALRGDLEVIVAKALEKDKSRRYVSAAELAGDLRRHLHDEPILARPASRIYQIRKFAKRNRGLVGGLAATMFVLVVGVIVAASLAVGEARQRRRAERNESVAQRIAYRASISAASAALGDRDIGLARRSLGDAPAGLRGWEWRYLSANLDDSLLVVDLPDHRLAHVHFTNGGKHVATELQLSQTRLDLVRSDVATGRIVQGPDTDEGIFSYGASRNGMFEARLACGAPDVVVEDVDGQQRSVFPLAGMDLRHGSRPHVLAISSDGTQVALNAISEAGDFHLVVVHFADGRRPSCTAVTSDAADVAAFSSDGRRLATAQSVGDARIWDTSTCRPLLTLHRINSRFSSLDFSADGATVATGSYAGMVQLWNVSDGAGLASVHAHSANVSSVRFAPPAAGRGARLWSASEDRTIKLWNVDGLQLLAEYHGHAGAVRSMELSPDGSHLATTSADGTVRIWDATIDGDPDILRGHDNYVYPVAFSPDGTRILSGGWEGYIGKPGCIKLWDADTGQLIAQWGRSDERALDAAFSVSGSLMAIATIADDTAFVRVYRSLTATPVATLTLADSITWISITFVRGGENILIATSDGMLRVWDPCTNEIPWSTAVGSLETDRVVASNATAEVVATGCPPHVIQLRDAVSFEVLHTLRGHSGNLRSLAFSPNGTLLASASEDGTVRLWDAHTGVDVATLTGHTDGVLGVTFSPDGSRIASCGRDQLIRIWDVSTFEEVARLRGHSSYVYAVAFSPDGSCLASSSGDSTIRLWETEPLASRLAARRERIAQVAALEPIVQRLYESDAPPTDVIERISRLTDIGDRQREVALQLAFRTAIEPSGRLTAN